MRGRIIIAVWKRRLNNSTRWKDKWEYVDKISFKAFMQQGKRKYHTTSMALGLGSYSISRDEIALIKLIYRCYGPADYNLRVWGKGKNRGIRVFWDGVVAPDKKFVRRRNLGIKSLNLANPSSSQRISGSEDSSQFIGRYMKTKTPGKWHQF